MPMTRTTQVLFILFTCAAVAGCGVRVMEVDNGPPVYRIDDGSLCEAPPGYPDILMQAGTAQVRSLFLSSTPPEVTAAAVTDLPSREELAAALYLSCGEYATGKLSKAVFRRQRSIYQEMRQVHLERGIQRWRDEPEGFEMSGKLCHFIFNGGNPDKRDVARLVPPQTSVDDCALHVSTRGGSHVRLGCSEGRWKMHWARQPLLIGPEGWINRDRSVTGTQYVPAPDCGWG